MKTKTFITFILVGLITTSFQFIRNTNSDFNSTKESEEINVIRSGDAIQFTSDKAEIPDAISGEVSDQVPLSDFLELKFGMFIHFNMKTYLTDYSGGYPDPSNFNPGKDPIDTDAWADAAVSAGMKYGVLTVKHSTGFCLWDSQFTTYDVMHPDCPYQKDLVAQFIKSFTGRGLKVGLYYNWRHPAYASGKWANRKVLPPECDPATHTMDEQKIFQKAQVAELISKYPDVFYIWNDACDPELMPAYELMAHQKSIRPDIIVSANWWDWSKKGTPYADIAVTELRHFSEDNKYPGETCWQLEQTWFWTDDTQCNISASKVFQHISMANNRNANFLLNVGPDQNGNIVESSINTLKEMGELWKQN